MIKKIYQNTGVNIRQLGRVLVVGKNMDQIEAMYFMYKANEIS